MKTPTSTLPLPAQPLEVLYESATTRVSRRGAAPEAVICKSYLGPFAVRRLRNEAGILTRLANIEGVVQLAAGDGGAGSLALRDRGGAALAKLLREGPLPIATLLRLARQLTKTIAALHRAQVIHCDINPSNVLVLENGEPLLIDFDLARLAHHPAGVIDRDAIEGTLGYLSPEQSGRTGHAVDTRSDLYALGATLYEMATGRPPFEAADTLQLIHDHLVREPAAPSTLDARVPSGLSSIILRLLAKSPEHRYQSAEGLLHDLARLQRDLESGGDAVFALGERDFSWRLPAPTGLIGRGAELARIDAAFTDALRTSSRTLLIEGAAGVGKSALAHKLRPMATAAGGWFAYGKFDQFQKDGATAGALTQAAAALGRLLLALPRDELEQVRRRVLDALGRNAGLITRLLPDFARLLGEQPEPPEVDPRQAELQLQQATLDLVRAIASRGQPLVIVLDDLQWASATSLRTFVRLVEEPGLGGLVLVGAYRPDEIDERHILAAALARLREQAQPPVQIALGNLTQDDLDRLVGSMLRVQAHEVHELALAIGAMTRGNPFDTVEMVNALRREGLLELTEQGWRWDTAGIAGFVGNGDVVDLLAARIARLPERSRELLECMSCLGASVDRHLLQLAAGMAEGDFSEALRPALQDGLAFTGDAGLQDAVSFRHDRVQQAVFDSMNADARARRQLAMARRIASAPALEADAAPQYLACIDKVTEAAEQRRVASLFHGLALTHAQTGAHAVAERYLAAAGALLAGDAQGKALRWPVDVARHAALYSLGRLDESDALFSGLQSAAREPLDLVEPVCLQMRSLDMRGRMQESLALGLHLLGQLGLHAPADYAATNARERLDSVMDWVAQDARMDHASRPQIRDARLLATAKLLGRSVRSALVRFDSDAIVWLLLESQRLWAEHGPCPELVAHLGRMAGVLISERQDFHAAYAVARHVMTVGEALGYEPQTSEARGVFSTYACHWMDTVEQSFRHVSNAFEGVRAGGDASYACYVHLVMFTALVEIAPTLDTTLDELEAGIALCRRTGNLHAATLHSSLRQALRALRGLTKPSGDFEEAEFKEETFLERLGKLPFVENSYSECRAMHALIMGEWDALARNAARGMKQLRTLSGYYMTAYSQFFIAIARAIQLQGDVEHRASLLAELDASREWLAARAADQPYNFLHLLRLVEAERARAEGDSWRAMAAFDSALREAQGRDRPWHRAIITERAGLFHLAIGLEHTGRKLLADAHDQYEAWGAAAKVEQMRREHGFLHATQAHPEIASTSAGSSNSMSPDALDLMGVLRASQALSSETTVQRLTARVTEVLAAMTGATKVLLLSWHDDEWWLLGESPLPLANAAERGLLPLTAVRYAERTEQPMLVDDAPADDRFMREAYFASVPICSLLAVPIAGQGGARAMLLLENRLGRAAFNAQRLDAVMLIAGQLATSLANAQLYESLEQRVRARTEELERTQAELVATARRAGKAEIANNVLHNVGNVLNSVNVSASLVRRTLSQTRIEGLSRAVQLIAEHEHDLPDFVAKDPRGQALRAYLTEVTKALRSERETAIADLDRLAGSIEHITHVVATQQSLAGPSSLLEMHRPQDLIEEALRMSAGVIEQCKVQVVRRFAELPPAALDQPRLLQILLNLIRNAAEAMERSPAGARCLTVSTRLERVGSDSRLHIEVQDTGEGISHDNLKRLFAHGFTTREGGHGFGLHSSASAALEMGGTLDARSEGPGQGAMFSLVLPFAGSP